MKFRTCALALGFALLAAPSASAVTPQVTDSADDAYRTPLGSGSGVPNPALSSPAYDIISATWTDAGRGSFTVSMTINGAPEAGVNYYPAANIGSDCIVYWIYRVGVLGRYNVFCNWDLAAGRWSDFLGTGTGSAVEVVGNTLSARFSRKRQHMPAYLNSHRVIGPFSANTCPAPEDCTADTTVDSARSLPDERFTI